MSVDLKAIRERAEKATPGPWTTEENKTGVWAPGYDEITHAPYSDLTDHPDAWEANRQFIAHAREDIPALLERVRVLEEALTPSGATKAAFIGEFRFTCDEGHEVVVPWTTVKAIMAAISARALSPERMPSDG